MLCTVGMLRAFALDSYDFCVALVWSGASICTAAKRRPTFALFVMTYGNANTLTAAGMNASSALLLQLLRLLPAHLVSLQSSSLRRLELQGQPQTLADQVLSV
jgi:hypothetical protein